MYDILTKKIPKYNFVFNIKKMLKLIYAFYL